MPDGEKRIYSVPLQSSFSLKTDDAETHIAGVNRYPDFQKDCVPDRNRAGPDGIAVSVLSETVMAWVEYN